MRKFLLLSFLLLPLIAFSQVDCNHTFSGKVTSNNEALPGTAIRLSNEKATATDVDGKFKLEAICPGNYEVEISFIGYKTLVVTIEINQNIDRTFVLEEDAKQLKEIQIQGKHENIEHAQNYVTLGEKQLAATAGKSLGESLKEISGVSTIQAGPGIFKPVIHGVHSNRILILNHGIRQEGQQWGAEHAPEVDPFIASEMIVIKDASAIKYGTDALGGVIVVNPAELPEQPGIGGSVNMVGQSNGRGGVVSGTLEGGINNHPGWGWRLQGTGKRIGDYHTPEYQLTNTGTKELDFSSAVGYHGDKFGAEIFYSHFQSTLGILKGTAISSVDDLWRALNSDEPQSTAPFSYAISEPRQEVAHDLVKITAHKEMDKSNLNFQYGFQHNARKEFNIRRGPYSDLPVIDLRLLTHTFEVEWERGKENEYLLCIGANGMMQQNQNIFGTQRIPFIPNYNSVSGGPFVVSKFFVKALTFDLGARYDFRFYNVKGYDFKNELFQADIDFRNVSATAGATVRLQNNQSFMSNLSSAWRPPHVAELYSVGTHQSAAANEYGLLLNDSTSEVRNIDDVDFRIEKALKWVNTYRYEKEKISFEATVYANMIFNYIYLKPIGITQTLTAALPALKYTQTDALFLGADLSAEWNHDRWTIAPKASLLRASDVTNDDYLVYIPSNRFELQGRYEVPKWKGLTNLFVEGRGRYTMMQTRAPRFITEQQWNEANESNSNLFRDDPSNFDFMAAPSGYFLVNAAIGVTLPVNKSSFEFRLSVDNMLNTRYRDYTNRFKYFADEMGRNVMLGVRFIF